MTALRDQLSHRAESVETPSGKWRSSENFPVGSFLIRRGLRSHVHAFYRFARNADDIADNPALTADDFAGMGVATSSGRGVGSVWSGESIVSRSVSCA